MSLNECSICYCNFSKAARKPIECNNCHFTACIACNKQFILGTNSEVKCMKCNVAWSMNFLFTNFPKKFVMEYRRHRRNILWNKELYHTPQIAAYIGHKSGYDKNQIPIKNLVSSISQKRVEYRALKGKRGKTFTEQRKKIKEEKKKLEKQLGILRKESSFFFSNYQRIFWDFCYNEKNRSSKSSYHRPCIQENCRGFLDGKGSCPICHVVVCLDCNILKKDEEHECKEDDVNTWKELKKNTRPCPKCNVRIHKISGCDQMWCVQCNTAFSWSKGIIEHGNIHNPHYFDWLFNGGGVNPGQGEVGGECNENALPHIWKIQDLVKTVPNSITRQIFSIYRTIQHIVHVEIPKYQLNQQNYRSHIFSVLVRHIRGQQNIDKLFESYLMRKYLDDEFSVILNNYKQQQIHFFHAMSNKTISDTEFLEKSQNLRNMYQMAFDKFNRFYNKRYYIHLG